MSAAKVLFHGFPGSFYPICVTSSNRINKIAQRKNGAENFAHVTTYEPQQGVGNLHSEDYCNLAMSRSQFQFQVHTKILSMESSLIANDRGSLLQLRLFASGPTSQEPHQKIT